MNKKPNKKGISVKTFFELLPEIENALYDVDYTNAFKKNVKLCYKRNLDLQLLVDTIEILVQNGFLPARYKPHPVKMYDCMECHTLQPVAYRQVRNIKRHFVPDGTKNRKDWQYFYPYSVPNGTTMRLNLNDNILMRLASMPLYS